MGTSPTKGLLIQRRIDASLLYYIIQTTFQVNIALFIFGLSNFINLLDLIGAYYFFKYNFDHIFGLTILYSPEQGLKLPVPGKFLLITLSFYLISFLKVYMLSICKL